MTTRAGVCWQLRRGCCAVFSGSTARQLSCPPAVMPCAGLPCFSHLHLPAQLCVSVRVQVLRVRLAISAMRRELNKANAAAWERQHDAFNQLQAALGV